MATVLSMPSESLSKSSFSVGLVCCPRAWRNDGSKGEAVREELCCRWCIGGVVPIEAIGWEGCTVGVCVCVGGGLELQYTLHYTKTMKS